MIYDDKSCPLWKKFVSVLATVSVEPVFLLDGFAYSLMVVLVESLQYDKICSVNLNYTEAICKNFDSFPEEEKKYNAYVSAFKRNDGVITSIIPLFFILFIGAWSDKYGRKVPLCLTLSCHILFSGGYLLNSIFDYLPVEFLLVVGFLDSLGGGSVAFLTVSNAYISDVTTLEERTSRVALANSLWFLGGPIGTLIGTEIYKAAGYKAVFSTSLVLYIVALTYVAIVLPESYGPFRDKEKLSGTSKPEPPTGLQDKRNISIRFQDQQKPSTGLQDQQKPSTGDQLKLSMGLKDPMKPSTDLQDRVKPSMSLRDTFVRLFGLSRKDKGQNEDKESPQITWTKMVLDFFDVKRVVLSFKCVFKKREGFTRLFICLLILSNFFRKIGRGAYTFYFTREVLKWDAVQYGYWATYKNLLSTLGSLIAVPILSSKLRVSDNVLAMTGALSSVVDYVMYSSVTPQTYFLMWLAPALAILVNSCSIAMRSMMSKCVQTDELGKVSSVTGTMEGIAPIISTSLYSAITEATFDSYPGTQFFFGAACNTLMAVIFVSIMVVDKGEEYNLEKAKSQTKAAPVVPREFVAHVDSNWLFDSENPAKIRLETILLTALNFSIDVSCIDRAYSKKDQDSGNEAFGKAINGNCHSISLPNGDIVVNPSDVIDNKVHICVLGENAFVNKAYVTNEN